MFLQTAAAQNLQRGPAFFDINANSWKRLWPALNLQSLAAPPQNGVNVSAKIDVFAKRSECLS